MPRPIDLAFAAVFAVAFPLWDFFVDWPRRHAALAGGAPDARRRFYRFIVAVEWVGAAIAVALWGAARRPWAALGLSAPLGGRFSFASGFVAAVVVLIALQWRSVRQLPVERRAAAVERMGAVSLILPRTAAERRWFAAVSVTAGVCEELLFRGFLIWALRPWLGLWGAALVSVALFGFGHAYQGRANGIRATITGAVFTGLALLAGSILPGIVAHAVIDLGGGETGYALLKSEH